MATSGFGQLQEMKVNQNNLIHVQDPLVSVHLQADWVLRFKGRNVGGFGGFGMGFRFLARGISV